MKYTLLLSISAVFFLGIGIGTGLMTFYYAEGGSYFSSDPEACVNCHIMRPQYESWLKSSHKNQAACVDCHLPMNTVEKYVAKAENGWHHSKAFTLQNFHEPILIKDKNAAILQDNCLRCHQPLVNELVGVHAMPEVDVNQTGQFTCVHCHADVGHGETLGMGVLEDYRGRHGLEQLKRQIEAGQD